MWLEAIFAREDLAQALAQLTPLRVELGDPGSDHYVYVGRPQSVELVEGRGLRVRTQAKLRWDVIGLRVPLTLRSVTFEVLPSVVHREGRDVLVFRFHLEEVDLTALPGLADRGLLDLVNKQLDKASTEIAWDFQKTLDWHIPLPKQLAPAEKFDLGATWGEVRITQEALVLAVSFRTHVQKSTDTRDDGEPLPAMASSQ
jgi:hypothetical protein